MTPELEALLRAVDDAVRWFEGFNTGKHPNGPNDAVLVPQRLAQMAKLVRERHSWDGPQQGSTV